MLVWILNIFLTKKGLGRSKFLTKPLSQDINMLLSECELNCHHDGSEKSTLEIQATPIPPLTETAIINPTTSIPVTAVPVKTIGLSANNCIDGVDCNIVTLDEDNDDDNRVG